MPNTVQIVCQTNPIPLGTATLVEFRFPPTATDEVLYVTFLSTGPTYSADNTRKVVAHRDYATLAVQTHDGAPGMIAMTANFNGLSGVGALHVT